MLTFWRAWTPIVAVAVGISACVVSSVQPLTVPLAYKASSKQPALVGAFACSAVSRILATDARTDKTLGMRAHESKPLKAEVSASGDAASWVAEGVGTYLTQTGIHVQGAGPALLIALESLRSSESIWHRASYESRIAMSARLQTPAGQICWEERFEGTSGDYGYAGNIETYQGTLNGALDAASLRLAESQGFRNALCQCGH
jgi:hypothetical protein